MQMLSYAFTRECNMARNRAIGASMGLKTGIFGRAKTNNMKKSLSKLPKAQNRSAGKVSYNSLRRSGRYTTKPNRQCVDKTQTSQTETRATPDLSSSGSVVGTPDPNRLQCTDGQLQSAVTSVAEMRTSPDPAQVPNRLQRTGGQLQSAIPSVSETRTSPDPALVPSRATSQTPATLSSPKPVFNVNKTGWPEWLTEKYDHYSALEFGDKWRECLFIWTEIERAFKFHNPVSSVFFILMMTTCCSLHFM